MTKNYLGVIWSSRWRNYTAKIKALSKMKVCQYYQGVLSSSSRRNSKYEKNKNII